MKASNVRKYRKNLKLLLCGRKMKYSGLNSNIISNLKECLDHQDKK